MINESLMINFSFVLICALQLTSALEPPLWVVQRKRDRYERNEQCMERWKREMDLYGLQPFRAVTAVRNTTLWLKCFECLHPDDADQLEDKWKPSSSIIGRKIHGFLQKIKEKIIRSLKKQKHKGDLTNYWWENLRPDKSDKTKCVWDDAVKYFGKNTRKEDGHNNETLVLELIEEVMNKGNDADNLYVGDHLELEIRKIQKGNAGWYRCMVRVNDTETGKGKTNKTQIYYVDVLDQIRTIMFDSNAPETKWPDEMKKVNLSATTLINDHPPLEMFWRRSEWTACNKCGERVGEKRRTISCFVRARCAPSKHGVPQTRKISINETGREEVLDMLPPDEFSINERLPPLAPPISRNTLFLKENDWITLDCSNQDGMSLIWRKDFVELNGTQIITKEDGRNMQRRIFTAEGNLLIRSARLTDAGLYSCTAYPSGHILRTFRVFIDRGDRSNQVLTAISMVIRALLLAYLLMGLYDLLNVEITNI